MRVPLPFILYAASAAMIVGSAWLVYGSRELWNQKTATDATVRGRDNAIKLTAFGKGQVRTTGDWNYGAEAWWEQMKGVNLIGFMPKVEAPGHRGPGIVAPGPPLATPLEDIFELVVCFNSPISDEGVQSHIVIRYKQEALVEPPQWWVDENTSIARAGSTTRHLLAQPRARIGNRSTTPQQPSPPPQASMAGREVLQHLSVDAQGDLRRASNLWGDYSNIRLVRVDPSGESAWFVRDVPAVDGQPKVEPKEEELLKTSAGISQKLALALRQLQGREGVPTTIVSNPTTRDWLDVETTTRIGNEFHIGRKDERMFEDPKDLFASVHLDTFVSRFSDTRGLVVRSIKPELATKFGIQTDDVLLSINNREVSSKPQAANMAKRSYQRGVRTFTTKWWSDGQEVERVYRAR
ncbi:MAG: hypothetical protein ACI89X_004405 [Planctomycetota bacterium]|jgi:hypothetical protein